MRYSALYLRGDIRFDPKWALNNEGKLPYRSSLKAPEFQIFRAQGESAYLVTHVESGEQQEVPMSWTKNAVLLPPEPAKQESARRKP